MDFTFTQPERDFLTARGWVVGSTGTSREYQPDDGNGAAVGSIHIIPEGFRVRATKPGARRVGGDWLNLDTAVAAVDIYMGYTGMLTINAEPVPVVAAPVPAHPGATRAPAAYHGALASAGWRLCNGRRGLARYELGHAGGTFAIEYDTNPPGPAWYTQWQPSGHEGAACWEHRVPAGGGYTGPTIQEGFLNAIKTVTLRMLAMG